MSATPKRGRAILYVIIGLVLACVICVGVVAVVIVPGLANVVNSITAPLTNSQTFMNDVIANDYTKAFSLVHPSGQATLGSSPDALQQYLTSKGWVPSAYTPTLNVQLINGTAYINGQGTFGGANKYVYFTLEQDNGTWKIVTMDVNDNPPTATPIATAG